MKPPPFEYLRPQTLRDAVSMLADGGEDAKLLAGGQSLVPLLNFRLARPSLLIDLGLVRELTVLEPANGILVVGAGVRQRTAETSSVVHRTCPLIARALRYVGHLQIRTRGTIGGSIAHADPSAELPAVALALDAELVAVSSRGERTIAASEFFFGPYMTDLAEDEILTQVRFPVVAGVRTAFVELARRSGDFALAGVAIAVQFHPGARTVADARLAAIGVGGVPIRLRGAEAALAGRELNDDVRADVGAAASAEVNPPTDGKADASYRKELLGVLVTRALAEVIA